MTSQYMMSLLLSLCLVVVSVSAHRERSGRRRSGRGLDRCRSFRSGCRGGRKGAITEIPHFLVDDYVDGENSCVNYVPAQDSDFLVQSLDQTVEEACQASGKTEVRLCVMRKHDARALLALNNLADDEMDDVDFSKANLDGFKYKGKCFECPIIKTSARIQSVAEA